MTGTDLNALMKDHARRSARTSHAEEMPETMRRMGYTDAEVAQITLSRGAQPLGRVAGA